MTNLEKFQDFYDSNSDDEDTTTKKAGPRRLRMLRSLKKQTWARLPDDFVIWQKIQTFIHIKQFTVKVLGAGNLSM